MTTPIIEIPEYDGQTLSQLPAKFKMLTPEESWAESVIRPLSDFPEYEPEESNINVLIKGRWLERGGSAWWVSTAGTGKSIASIQLALSWTEGLPFAGLQPYRPINSWIIQSEDSPTRVTIDREDIIKELENIHPKVNWRKAAKKLKFVDIRSNGARFIKDLKKLLTIAQKHGELPDVIIINPFLAYVGGPITDGSYVTPFLRGGDINRESTIGLQRLLEHFNIAALIFHHTPKPPSAKELEAWMKSAFPEYQGAGSSDITNWGRSFVTMMKCQKDPRMVCITAGKNGSEIGWEMIDGAYRHYLKYSDEVGITGRGRHAWRELTEIEIDDIKGIKADEESIARMVSEMHQELRTHAMYYREIFDRWGKGRVVTAAFERLKNDLDSLRLTSRTELVGRNYRTYYGLTDGIKEAVVKARQQEEIDEMRGEAK